VTLQCPSKKHGPRRRGQSVGGVSERAGAKAGGIIPSALLNQHSFACRDGGRHPGLWKGVTLRGVALERRPRVGPSLGKWFLHSRGRAADNGCPKAAKEGNVRQHARIKRMHLAQAGEILAGDEGTRPSLGPSTRARRSSLCIAAQASMVRRTQEHHGWANWGNPEEPTLGLGRTDVARLAAGHRSRKGGSVVGSRKGRESWFPSLRGSRVVLV